MRYYFPMNTDKIPRKNSLKNEYDLSESIHSILLPPAEPSRSYAKKMELALAAEDKKGVQAAANAISKEFAAVYEIPTAPVRVLGVRPRLVTEKSVWETFGDYDTETMKIRLWMRTAILQKPSAFGTLLSTLCHELCHHLDVVQLELPNTYHTRAFYERAGLLYHHIRNTAIRPLVWTAHNDGTFSINWPATMRRK
ncbi:MAG: hypothetical protein K2X27_22135 [Candidatus Obscuribacterales bacterium]|nr:hypothetical protein [Candidatus Obscuribacterales bacterium]